MITLGSAITIPVNTIEVPVNPAYLLIDDSSKKVVAAKFDKLPKALVLWTGDEYDSIGNWTQEQADQKITELLGSDPASVLKTLIPVGVKR
jgi:hypothetical protein